ncbi:MAG: hypothetical protein WCV79_00630 [Candidatus Paceibacterota bacterium]
MRYYFAAFFITVIFVLPWFAMKYPVELTSLTDSLAVKFGQLAAVVSHNPKTIAGLQSTYNIVVPKGTAKIRVLVVPGHEPEYGGAEYGDLKERDINVELSRELIKFLEEDGHYQVFTTRDEKSWHPTFEHYFNNDWDGIHEWQKAHKSSFTELVRIGQVKPAIPSVFHTDAPEDVALRLYGIDKWSNENSIDIMIHVHFNDYPRANKATPGKYTGFAIYIPERTYFNSSTTDALAQTIFARLAKYNPVSNFAGEKEGIVPDQDLIAVGSYNSVDAASMLIEYGYLYESQYVNPDIRSLALKDLAYQTYLGLQDFFDPTNTARASQVYDTLLLPHEWTSTNMAKGSVSSEVYALQTALLLRGLYPPPSSTLNECPRTGKMGPCTEESVVEFQKIKKVTGEKGKVGPKTREYLNKEFGAQVI